MVKLKKRLQTPLRSNKAALGSLLALLLAIVCLAHVWNSPPSGPAGEPGGNGDPAPRPPQPATSTGRAADPNIIVVLSEAFWDPTLIKTVRFSRDPIPFFHSLQRNYTNGWMLSPQFGGLTANVEFEVLTGNSMRFLPEGTVAYENDIHQGVDSLASILARQGYVPTAISPYHNWFANSREVYRLFGFARFISMEFFDPDEYEGPYIADRAVARRIIEESRRSAGPDFIYANTMENHYHFYPGKFAKNTIDVTGDADAASRGLLETYAQGVSAADDMLRTLVEYFGKSKEPTVLVFFGDHLPYFEENYKVYRDTGYLRDNDPDFLAKMYSVPVVIWNNFLPDAKETIHFSPSFLGPYVLHMAGRPGTAYTDYLYSLAKRVPLIPPKEYDERMNVSESDLREYEAMQRDILFGERNVYGDAKDHIVNEAYTLGYGDLRIDKVSPDKMAIPASAAADDQGVTITVQGGRFGLGSIVYAGGQPLQTTWKSEATLTAVVPPNMYDQSGALEVQVKVVDSKQTVLAVSNTAAIRVSR